MTPLKKLLDVFSEYTGNPVSSKMEGPVEPKELLWNGKLFDQLDHKTDLLLKFLWGENCSPN